MELSQISLAMLLLGGIPVGVALNLVYAMTDIEALSDGIGKKLLRNTKDFVFVIIAGIVAALILYYVNDGEFRYMVLIGMIGGFAVSHMTIEKGIIRVRNASVRVLMIPITWIWCATLGRIFEKARAKAQINGTQTRTEQLMHLASNGFEI